MKTSKVLIHGDWIESLSKEEIDVFNPSTGEIIAKIPNCNEEDVEKAVQSALVGFEIWKNTPAEKRAQIIHNAADLIRRNADAIAEEISQEMGKPLKSARGEVVGSSEIFDFFAEEGLRIKGDIYQYNYADEQVQIIKDPVGVVVGITAANYPVALLTWKLGAALAAGCSFISKPDERSTAAALSFGRLFLEAGLPKGVLNVISGNGLTGSLLVNHQHVAKIAFTGSIAIGRKVAAMAAGTCKRVSLELGGQCPAIVMNGTDPEKIMGDFISQTFNNSGQYCYRINRAYVYSDIYDDFVRVLLERVAKLKVGAADEPGIDQGPLYHKNIFDHAMTHIEDAVAKGAQLLCGGHQIKSIPNTYFIEPTVFDQANHSMLIMSEETFGPILSIMKIHSFSEAIKLANDSIYGLAAFVYAPDAGLGLQAARQLEAGVVWVNKIHKAYNFAPFGGFKQSGYGREKSDYGLDEYLEIKTVYLTLPTVE